MTRRRDRRRDKEMETMAPLYRRSLIESSMRRKTTTLDVVVVVVFLLFAVVLLVVFGPGFFHS